MNIALFASAFYPSLGGVEELCRQLAMELLRQGHGVIVLTNRWPRDLPAAETLDGVPVFRLAFRLPEGSAKAAINYHLTHQRIEREMLGILRAHKIDLLHVQCVSSNAHYAMIAQEKLKLPLVVTLQGELTMDANQVFEKSAQAREILRRSLDRADVITACSGKTLRDGEEFYGKPFGERGRVIFNGVNLGEFVAAPAAGAEHLASSSEHLASDASGQGEPARPNESTALPKHSNSYLLTSNSSSPQHSNSYLLTPSSSPRRAYIFALGRMAKQKGFDVLIRAYAALRFDDQKLGVRSWKLEDGDGVRDQKLEVRSWKLEDGATRQALPAEPTESAALPNHSNSYLLASNSSPPAGRNESAALPENSRFQVPGSEFFPKLVLAGDGPELEGLKGLARELGLRECVHFPGRADRQQVAAYLSGCEFFVISSPAEPFGIVVLEAMAAGAAVIAVNNAGPAEIITDGVNGLLAERSAPEPLAAAMQRLIRDAQLRERLAAAGKVRAAEFGWPKVAGQYAEAYVAATAKKLGVRS